MKNIIITGSANGVGKAIANTLKGNNLILIDADNDNLSIVANDLNAEYYVCDLTDVDNLKATLDTIIEKHETIDCLINCAGMWISGEMSKLEEPLFGEMNNLNRIKQVIDTNVFATIAMIKNIFPIMKKQGYGQIINIIKHKTKYY